MQSQILRVGTNETPEASINVFVVGLGHQSIDDHIPAITDSRLLNLVGVVDIDSKQAELIGSQYNVPWAVSVEELLKQIKKPNIALIAVPHSGYLELIEKIASLGISIIKEKPFAISLDEASRIIDIVRANQISLYVTLQRRFNPIFTSYGQLVRRIGAIHSIEARYTMNIERLDEGWRASSLYSGGGALIDLGYHYVDLICWYFGLPDAVSCKLSTGNRKDQTYDVEDTAFLDFSYNEFGEDNERVLGNLVVSRVYPDKHEQLTAYGEDGSVSVMRGKVVRRDTKGNEAEVLERQGSWPSALIEQLEVFARNIMSETDKGKIRQDYLEQVSLIEASYQSAKSHKSVNPEDILKKLQNQAQQ